MEPIGEAVLCHPKKATASCTDDGLMIRVLHAAKGAGIVATGLDESMSSSIWYACPTATSEVGYTLTPILSERAKTTPQRSEVASSTGVIKEDSSMKLTAAAITLPLQ